MNIYQGRVGLAVLILLAAQCSFDASAADDMMAPLFDCSVSQLSMVAGSNQTLMVAEGVSEKDLRIEAEEQGGKIALHLYDRRKTQTPETPGAGDLGWVTYDPQNNSLTDVNDSPLTFNQEAGKRYQQCLQRAKKCQSLFRAYPIRTILLAILDLGSAQNPHVLRVRSGFCALSVSKLAAPITPTGIGS